jgi:hypothetical protein
MQGEASTTTSPQRRRKFLLCALAGACLLAVSAPAGAETFTWTGTRDKVWTTGSNWSPSPLVSGTDSVVALDQSFTIATTLYTGSRWTLNSLTINTTRSFSISGSSWSSDGALTLVGTQAITRSPESYGTQTIACGITCPGATTFDISGSNQLRLTGTLSLAGTLTKTGNGELAISDAASRFNAPLFVSQGSVVLMEAGLSSSAAPSSAVFVAPGATLAISGTTWRPLDLGGTLSGTAGSTTFKGPVHITGTATFAVYRDITLNEIVGSAYALEVVGSRTLYLTGYQTNALDCPWAIRDGTLSAASPEVLGSGAVEISQGGRLQLGVSADSYTQEVRIVGSGTIAFAYDEYISRGPVSLSKPVWLSSGARAYLGAADPRYDLTLNGGLELAGDASISGGCTIDHLNQETPGSSLYLQGGSVRYLAITGSSSFSGPVVVGSETVQIRHANALGSQPKVQIQGGTLFVSLDSSAAPGCPLDMDLSEVVVGNAGTLYVEGYRAGLEKREFIGELPRSPILGTLHIWTPVRSPSVLFGPNSRLIKQPGLASANLSCPIVLDSGGTEPAPVWTIQAYDGVMRLLLGGTNCLGQAGTITQREGSHPFKLKIDGGEVWIHDDCAMTGGLEVNASALLVAKPCAVVSGTIVLVGTATRPTVLGLPGAMDIRSRLSLTCTSIISFGNNPPLTDELFAMYVGLDSRLWVGAGGIGEYGKYSNASFTYTGEALTPADNTYRIGGAYGITELAGSVLCDGPDGLRSLIVGCTNGPACTVALSGSNTYSGGTTIYQTALLLDPGGAGTGPITNRGTLQLGCDRFNSPLLLNGYVAYVGTGACILSSTITMLSTTAGCNLSAMGGTLIVQSSLSLGVGYLSFGGSGAVCLSGTITGGGGTDIRSGVKVVVEQNVELPVTKVEVYSGSLIVNGAVGPSGTWLFVHAAPNTTSSPGLLGGSGVVRRAVKVDGVLAPGESVGCLTIDGNLTLTATGCLAVEIGLDDHGQPANDCVRMLSGNVQLGGATLSLDCSALGAGTGGGLDGQEDLFLWLINNEGSGTLLGQFAGLADDAPLDIAGRTFHIRYGADFATANLAGGNDVVLTTVPEPSLTMVLLAGLACLVGRRRSRQ